LTAVNLFGIVVGMGYRTTTQVRIKKATLERLRSLSYERKEDMVDLLNLAVVLLERELFNSAGASSVVFPAESTEYQLPFGARVESERISFPVASPITQQVFQTESEQRHGG